MRICFVAPASSYHTKKWAQYFIEQGHDVHVVTLDDGVIDGVITHRLKVDADVSSSDREKIAYLAQFKKLRLLLSEVNPDVVSAHYASSYGTLTALACSKPYALSVWGGDVYEFPQKSIFHRKLIEFSLKRASVLLSTSRAMAKEASKYTDKDFKITPFGVNEKLFKPIIHDNGSEYIVTTIKALTPKYGIDVLILACADVMLQRPDINIKLRIAGKGPMRKSLEALAVELGLESSITWLGFITQEEAAAEWAHADVAVIPSIDESESFGVSAVEAQACGVPVIISDIPGLMESTIPGYSSLVFRRGDCEGLAQLLIKLHDDRELSAKLGHGGRRNVEEKFTYKECFSKIEEILISVTNFDDFKKK